jgi:hypothetical protein
MVDTTLQNSTYNAKNGRYTLGGTTEVSSWAMEWWNQNTLTSDPSDIVYYVEKKYVGRPQFLGYIFYGDVGLWWVIMMYNGILDPFAEIIEGKLLNIPLLQRVKANMFSSNISPGGIASTRPTSN